MVSPACNGSGACSVHSFRAHRHHRPAYADEFLADCRFEVLRAAVDSISSADLKALVIGNDAQVFCAGADLASIAAAGESGGGAR